MNERQASCIRVYLEREDQDLDLDPIVDGIADLVVEHGFNRGGEDDPIENRAIVAVIGEALPDDPSELMVQLTGLGAGLICIPCPEGEAAA